MPATHAAISERRATLSIAESCTGGMVGERITSVAGSSEYFAGGFVTYTDRMKTDLLGVDPRLITEHTAVSTEVAQAMAENARARTGSTFALSITGEAGPESGSGAPVGTVFICFAGPGSPAEAVRLAKESTKFDHLQLPPEMARKIQLLKNSLTLATPSKWEGVRSRKAA